MHVEQTTSMSPEWPSGTAKIQMSRHDVTTLPIERPLRLNPGENVILPCENHPFVLSESGIATLELHLRSKLGQAGMDILDYRIKDGIFEVGLVNKSGGQVALHAGESLAIGNPFRLSHGIPIQGDTLGQIVRRANQSSRCKSAPFEEALFAHASLPHDRDSGHSSGLDLDSVALPVTMRFRRNLNTGIIDLQNIPSGTDREHIHRALGLELMETGIHDLCDPSDSAYGNGLVISGSPSIRLPANVALRIQKGVVFDDELGANFDVLHCESTLLKPSDPHNGKRYDHPIIFETEDLCPDFVFCYAYPFEVVD